MQGTLDFTGSEHWAPLNFPKSTALKEHHITFMFKVDLASNRDVLNGAAIC